MEPDVDQNKLVCRLEHHTLDEHPKYIALSYEWGDDKITTKLQCDDGFLHITKNLEAVLYVLRQRRKRRWLWVDAICICQNDPDEKAAQIQIMRHIYARAMQTIVWLGEAGDDGFLAIGLIYTLNHYILQHPEWKGKMVQDDLYNLGISRTSRPLLWQALSRFFDRSYFHRVWVMQEVAVSKNPMVLFGSMSLDYSVLERVTVGMPAGFKLENFLPDGIFKLRSAYQTLRIDNHALPLSYLTFWDNTLRATMAVDKVYAWVGLSDEAGNPVFQPDYRSDERSVFLHIGKNLLLRHMEKPYVGVMSPLYLLHAGGIRKGRYSTLPTWLSIPPGAHTPNLVENQMISLKQRFSVSGSFDPRLRFSDNSDVLYVQGRKLDCITFVGPKMGSLEPQYPGDDRLRGIDSAYAVFERERCAFARTHAGSERPAMQIAVQDSIPQENLAHPVKPSPPETKFGPQGMPWEELYWRTTIFNTDDTGNIAGPEFGKNLDDWHVEIQHQEWKKTHPESDQCPFDHSFQQGSFAWSLAANEVKSYERRMFVTERGYIGQGHSIEEVGDVICLLYGCAAPTILRPKGNHYLMVGDCYIHSIMNGEALEWRGVEDTEFEIH